MEIISSALLPFITGIISFLVYRHSINKDKSSLVLDFIKEVEKEYPSKLVVEYLFSVIYRAKGTEFSDIILLVNHPSPQRAITSYLSVQRRINAISLINGSEELGVVIHKEWAKGWRRILRQFGYLISGVIMYFLAIYFSNSSYDYLSIINKNSMPALIKDSGFAFVAMDIFVNLSIPMLFSIAGYFCFRDWASSLIIDGAVKFLRGN